MECTTSTSSSHAGLNTFLISAIFALRAIVWSDDTTAIVFTAERQAVAGVAKKECLQTHKHMHTNSL